MIGIGTPVSGGSSAASPPALRLSADRFLGRGRLLPGQIGGHRVEGTGLLVQPVDPVEVMVGDLDRRQLALADRGGEFEHGQVMYLGHANEQ